MKETMEEERQTQPQWELNERQQDEKLESLHEVPENWMNAGTSSDGDADVSNAYG